MIQIYTDERLTVKEKRIFKRTWKERLFSWPWRPWRKTKVVTIERPDWNVYPIGRDLVCHPAMERQVRQAISMNLTLDIEVPANSQGKD